MQPPISEATKHAIIEEYLRGKNRDEIARDLHLGAGTVSKKISEWKMGLDYPIADELRELVVWLRKQGISASRYAEGARIASYLVKLGVNDEEFHQFISGIYERCKKMDLQPEKITYLLKQLLDLSESVPLAQIPEFIEQQRSQVQKLKEEKEKLDIAILNKKADLCVVLDEEKTTRDELDQLSFLKAVMKENGVTMLDNTRFVDAVVGAKELGFNARVIVEKVSNLAKLETDQKALEEKVKSLDMERQYLEQKCSYYEEAELVHAHRISIYEELEKIGMGIKELKLLWHTVAEIAAANNISEDKATEKFFSDVQKQYDSKLSFESELQNKKSEIEKNEHTRLQATTLTAILNDLIISQLDQIQSMSGFVEFGPLVNAAKGRKVSKNQLKNAVIKAIDILINSDPTDRSTATLKSTKLILQNDIRESGIIVPRRIDIQESGIIFPSQSEIQDIYCDC
jgi:hypothetical protein